MTVPHYHNYFASDMVHHNTVVMDLFRRVFCQHPQKHKNIAPEDKIRTVRIACENLPGEKDEEETRNTIYPVIKRRFPPHWIKRDITQRKPVLTVCGPHNRPVQIEFVSYGQEVQAMAGVQRRLIIQDEESNKDFFEEQQARTLATGGDIVLAFTPVPGSIGWMFDDLYERARIICRTKAVRDRMKDRFGEDLPEIQRTGRKDDICVIQCATDDNPVYDELARQIGVREGRALTGKQYLDEFFSSRYADEDVIDARRYGIFRQLSGKVYKIFGNVHVIDGHKYFPAGVPEEWIHARAIDYHQANPWAVLWVAVSPRDEIFVYRDAAYSPGRMKTWDIASAISMASGTQRFRLDLIDALAQQTQVNTNMTTIQDLNRYFQEFRSQGQGTGAYWQSWDTKGTRGREEMTKRLINASKCGAPFNNEVVTNGKKQTLPTVWFFSDCRQTIEAMKQWRYEDWGTRGAEQTHDAKEKPQGKWSHFPVAIECLLKSPVISMPRFSDRGTEDVWTPVGSGRGEWRRQARTSAPPRPQKKYYGAYR